MTDEISVNMEIDLLRSYLKWAVAQIEYMNEGKELSTSEWDEDAVLFIQAKQMAESAGINHVFFDGYSCLPDS